MACDQIAIQSSQRTVKERSSLTVTASFRNRATAAAVTPTNVYYRLDDQDNCLIRDWTSATPGTTAAITLSAADNAIQNGARTIEKRILSVMTDRGLSTQYADTFTYELENLPWTT